MLRSEMLDIAIVDIPEGAADGISAYTTWAFGVAVHAHPDMDEETAYQIVKAVMENPDPQVNAFSAMRDAQYRQDDPGGGHRAVACRGCPLF